MKIHVPKDMGGQLKVVPNDTYRSAIGDVWVKLAKSSGEPKATVKWILKSECSVEKIRKSKDYESTVGVVVLEDYSLQEQAMWRLNDLYLELTGEGLPGDEDFSQEEFQNMLQGQLKGLEANLTLKKGEMQDGTPRMDVDEVKAVK